MKSIIRFSILILLSGNILFAQANSPWKWKNPTPQGNYLRYVKVFSSTTWYALGYYGTFLKTTDGGANWYINHHVFGVPTTSIYSIYNGWFTDLNTGFACGSSGRLARTTDGGTTWDSVGSGVTGTLYGMHFINASTGFISTTTSGNILKTTNGGLNWTTNNTGSSTSLYNIFSVDANHIYVSRSTGYIRRTTNGGTNWSEISTGSSTTLYDVCFKDVNTGWVCGSSGRIRRTTNGGTNWTETSTGLPTSTLYGLTYASNTVYANGHAFYVFRSTDFGVTWDSLDFTGNQYYTSTYYAFDRNGTTMANVGSFGLFNSSTNSGANWTAHNYAGFIGTTYGIWCNSMNGLVIAVGSYSPVSIIRSTNGGNTWQFTVAENIGSSSCYNIDMVNSNTGYASGSSSYIFKTTNGGSNWDSTKIYATSTTLYGVDFVNATTGYTCGSSGRVFKTTNGGTNWTLLTTGTTSTLYGINFVNATTGWIIGSSGTLRKTTDGGTSWTAQTPGYTSTLRVVQMINSSSGYLAGYGGTVRKTTNGGTNWLTVTTPFTQTQYNMSFSNMNTGYVTGSSGYTIRTSNGGTNWEINNTGGSSMYSVFTKGYDSAWAGGSTGAIFKLYDVPLGGISWQNQIPDNFTLSQNFPNPFNPSTTIKFGMPKAGNVSFKIYDITGSVVESVFDNVEMNAGTVTYVFDGKNYASGVYFYTLTVNDQKIDTKKMILVK